MKVNRIYFSPTNSTKKVLELISGEWDGEIEDIDISNPHKDYSAYCFAENELCLIGVPSFGGRVPAIALERLVSMKASATPTVLVATFGNRAYDDTLLELKDALSSRGFHIVAAIAAATEHSLMHQYGTGRPNADDQKELKTWARRIKDVLAQGANLPEIEVKGTRPYVTYTGLPLNPSAHNRCTQCGVCAAQCPTEAIPSANPKITDKDRCITCMRCVALCPEGARKINPVVLFVAGIKMKKACVEQKPNELFFEEAH
ncbi:MAG: 4Fe-4S binding protein [Raoultibacter sp.]